ncbi:MAG: EAL domain-containing protein [Gammaproteobacteria bacterium]
MLALNTIHRTNPLIWPWISLTNLVFFLFSILPAAVYGSTSENIFILHSYSQEYTWTRDQHAGFTATYLAGTSKQAIISTEYLDTKRTPYTKPYAEFFSQYLQQKYINYQPKFIYVTDDNALNFAIDHMTSIFPQAVVIFSGINDYEQLNTLDTERFTGVFEKKEIAPNIELLRLTEPDISEILVVGDNSNTYQAIKQEIKQQLYKYPDITASYIASNNIEHLTRELLKQKQKYLFLTTIGAMTDKTGNQLGLKEIIDQITAAGNFIIISMEDSYLLKGVMGGYVTSGKQQGHTAANLALAYDENRDILPAETNSPNLYIFDYLELERHKLKPPESILATATILHRPASFYERNRILILTSIAILTTMLMLSMAIFLNLLSRKNKKIQSTSDKLALQTRDLESARKTLIDAQKIAHLGNWEWNIADDTCYWSDEMYRILGIKPQSIPCGYEKLLSYVPNDDRTRLQAIVDNAIHQSQAYEIEHKLISHDHAIKYVRHSGNIYCDEQNKVIKVVGTLLDISTMKKNEFIELIRLERIERYQEALLDWSRTTYKTIDESFRKATEISAFTLGVKRVSIWLFNHNHTSLTCNDLYILSTGHESRHTLERKDFPIYFNALDEGKIMMIPNARTDERCKEFTDIYLIPNNIYSMLDIPIMYQGEIIGVVCHEHTGEPRQWEPHEQEFASAISNTVSLSLEIEKRKQIEQELEHQAYHDALTKLPNRTLFMDRLNQAIKLAHRSQNRLAVMFLDLDNFKEINDSLGHSVGDQVLIMTARKLQSSLREVDTIARLGGDEYCLILGSFQQPQHINDVATKLFHELQKPMILDNHELYVTSSIGISIYPEDGETADTLLRNADAAMYKAKKEGRNSYQFYTQDMTERAFERILIENNLRRALKQDEFIVYYQPQYDASDDSLIGLEALVRWNHPEMGLVSPARFIPVAEETGLIVQLDRWVFQTAAQQISHWYNQGYNPGRLALNLAMKQLHQEDFIEFIYDVLAKTQCQPQWLELEVTEGQIMKKPEHAIAVLKQISNMGIDIAVDDFGTGYSSLTYLKRLPVNKLKIDQSFIQDIPGDEEDVAIVHAVIALAKSMNLSVIAEGVETNDQKNFLLQHGCNLIQGYLYGAPMEARDFEQFLK